MKHSLSAIALSLLIAGCNSSDPAPSTPDNGGKPTPDNPDPTEPVKPIPPFNLSSVAKATGNALTFSWDGEASGITYDVCQKDTSQPDNCLVINTSEGKNEATVQIRNLIDASASDYFIRATRGSEKQTSNELAPDSSTINSLIQYVKASNTGAYEVFGYAHALSDDGNVLVVGASMEASSATGINGDQLNDDMYDAGAIYVFRRNLTTNEWEQEAFIKSARTKEEMYFGEYVDISADGTRFVTSAYGESSDSRGINQDDTPVGADYSGAGYIFKHDGTNWVQEAYIKASNSEADDYFGTGATISADGKTVVFGATGEDSASGIDKSDNSSSRAGAAYVFDLNEGSGQWEETGYLKPSSLDAGDRFGGVPSINADGTVVVVASWREAGNATTVNGDETNNDASNSGAAYVFDRSDRTTNWTQAAYLKAPNNRTSLRYAGAVSISDSGDTVAVSSINDSSNATGVDGDIHDTSMSGSGAVFIYSYDQNLGQWEYSSYLKASNTESGARFGTQFAFTKDGKTLIVTSDSEDFDHSGIDAPQANDDLLKDTSGSAYIFKFNTNTSLWEQANYLKSGLAVHGNRFGSSVSVSGDGSVFAVGSSSDASTATGLNGDRTLTGSTNSGSIDIF